MKTITLRTLIILFCGLTSSYAQTLECKSLRPGLFIQSRCLTMAIQYVQRKRKQVILRETIWKLLGM